MAHWGVKTEHAGAKNGGGYYGHRVAAKADSNVKRRANDKQAVDAELRELGPSERKAQEG